MCGIVGYVGNKRVVPVIMEGLRRLEYRGYDSAGIAVAGNGEGLQVRRAEGKLRNLEEAIRLKPLDGTYGIGHTRWATHGVPSERNAHPHVSGGVSVVHNGIIENHDAMRARLQGLGYEFSSDTDTEVIPHLVLSLPKSEASLFDSVRAATQQLVGAYAIAVISGDDPQRTAVPRSSALRSLARFPVPQRALTVRAARIRRFRRHRPLRRPEHRLVQPVRSSGAAAGTIVSCMVNGWTRSRRVSSARASLSRNVVAGLVAIATAVRPRE